MAESHSSSDLLFSRLMDRIHEEFEIDYTMNISRDRPPLYDLAEKYRQTYPDRPLHSRILISEMSDPVAEQNRTYPKLWIEVGTAARLIPDPVMKRLLEDGVSIELNDGAGSYYDPLTTTISIKGAQDFLHEIGHYAWNTWLIREDEQEKKEAVNSSSVEGGKSRKRLPEKLIPEAHKEYALLVGAYSGQFLEDPDRTNTGRRKNDLEEHFARNADYLMRGRPIDVTKKSKARLKEMLAYYIRQGLSDKRHVSLYRYLLKEGHGKKSLNAVDPRDAQDGIELTRDELFLYHKLRKTWDSGKKLDRIEEISLALDLSEDFIRFCISKKAAEELNKAIKQKGVTLLKI
jgi:hypothetical protein